MKNGQKMAALSLILLSTVFGSLLDRDSVAAESENSKSARILSPAQQRLEALKNKWSNVSEDQLRAAVQTGDAEAQYYFGLKQWELACKVHDKGGDWRRRSIGTDSPTREAATERWGNTSEAETRKAAEAGDKAALIFMSFLEWDRGLEQGRNAFGSIKRAAELGLAEAQFDSALFYLGKYGKFMVVQTDPAEARKWLQKAADQGHEPAIHKLADLLLDDLHPIPDMRGGFFHGEVYYPNVVRAVELLQLAVDQDCPRAQYDLAMRYAQGDGEPRNDGETPTALLRKAARADHRPALMELARRHRYGVGMHRDYIIAIDWYDRARQQPATERSFKKDSALGILEMIDHNFEIKPSVQAQDMQFAQVLGSYRKATERHDAKAMYQLGQYYLNGEVVPENPVQALTWFQLSASRGCESAIIPCDRLKNRLSPEDVAEATRRQSALIPGNLEGLKRQKLP